MICAINNLAPLSESSGIIWNSKIFWIDDALGITFRWIHYWHPLMKFFQFGKYLRKMLKYILF